MPRPFRYALLLCFAFAAGCASYAPVQTRAAEVDGLTDPLETSFTVSSMDYERPVVVKRGEGDPSFFGSFPKGEDGKTEHFIVVRTNAEDWRFWTSARIGFAEGLETVSVERIGSDVKCSRYGCSHFENAVASVSRSVIERVAASDSTVALRLSGRGTVDVGLLPAEARVFLAAVDSSLAAS